MIVIEKYIYIFFVYSISGWIMECIRGWIKTGKFINRGFLIGPCLPIYGVGLLLITIFLGKYVNDLIVLFFMSIILCGILEYFTSWAMEIFFNARWWDYHNRKYNINGRICLETLIPFGFIGTILLKYINPVILSVFERIPEHVIKIILLILLIVLFIDYFISFVVISRFGKLVRNVEKEKDNTEEMSNMVKKVTKEKIENFKDNISEKTLYTRRKIILKLEQIEEKSYYTRKIIFNKIYDKKKEFNRVREENKNKIKTYISDSKNKIKMTLNNEFINQKEFTNEVKMKFSKNWLNRRFLKAFPDLQAFSKKINNKKN